MKILDMHCIIFHICKSNQIKRNYERTSATMATKQVCWPHSLKPEKYSCQTSLKWNTGHLAGNTCRNQVVFFSSPLLICSFLPSLLCQNAFLCNAPSSICWQEQCPAGGSLPGHPGSRAVSLPTLLQRHSSPGMSSSSCWMSVAPKTQKPPTQNNLKLPDQLSMGALWSTMLPFDVFTLMFWIFGLSLTNSQGKKSNLGENKSNLGVNKCNLTAFFLKFYF